MYSSILEQIEKFKLPIGLSVLGLVLIIGGIFSSGLDKQKVQQFPKESLVSNNPKIISVDVSGAVVKPGVYQLKDGDRIEEAIKESGGFAENANQEYIAKYLNMAQKIIDGTKIYVPIAGEDGVVAGAASPNGIQTKVNINTASSAELEALSGVGAVTARKIISGRPYQQAEDLLSKKVVGKTVKEKLKD
ncbi:helix-hairpin-helix domain-containing protein [Candidatus Daviesbacteria bacterium]|nr:helix-hairpin-helix domain-containing protein [Candidatus Daviesbacteria bacterium]